jgi:fucose permease
MLRLRLLRRAARSQVEDGMEAALAVICFLGAAFVGRLVECSRIASYLDDRRWLRVGAFALAFFLIAAILTGGPHPP